MKKFILIGAIAVVVIAALGMAGFAYAQGQTPSTPLSPNGRGSSSQLWMGNGAGRGQGRMGGMRAQATDGSYGLLHDEMINSMAQTLDITAEQLQTRLDAGETMWTIAQEQGISAETFSQLMTQARTDAISQAVADGTITQAQADFMNSRAANQWPEGYGPGSTNCDGSGIQAGISGTGRGMARGRGMGMGFQTTP